VAQSTPTSFRSPDEQEAFTVLVLRYLDDDSSGTEVQHLKDALGGDAWCRELFVQMCRMHGDMHEAFAAKRAALQQKASLEKTLSLASAGARQATADAGVAATVPRPARASVEPSERLDVSDLAGDPLVIDDGDSEAPAGGAAGDTVVRELSGEDTAHPAPKPPEE
jgi:hypothetical protein